MGVPKRETKAFYDYGRPMGNVHPLPRPHRGYKAEAPTGKMVAGMSVALLLIAGALHYWNIPEPLTAGAAKSIAPSAPPMSSDYAAQPFPANGAAEWYVEIDPTIVMGAFNLTDRSGMPDLKVLRLRSASGEPVAQVYLRPGETAQVMLPQGTYRATLAMGNIWYGPQIHFGGMGRYFDMGMQEIIDGSAGRTILPSAANGDPMPDITGSNF